MIAGRQLSIGDASSAKLPSRFTVTDGNSATDHGVLDVIENTNEKNFFSGGLAGDAWDVSLQEADDGSASALKCVGETGSKVMNCDELSPFLRPWQAISH